MGLYFMQYAVFPIFAAKYLRTQIMKKNVLFLVITILFITFGFAQNSTFNSLKDDNVISNYQHLSARQLLDTAHYYRETSVFDKAAICYTLIINTPTKDTDIEQQQIRAEALNGLGGIYYYLCDYSTATEFFIKSLILCEKINYESFEAKIYNNLGMIYWRFPQYDMARKYFSKAVSLCTDSLAIVLMLNNLCAIELEEGRIDSAFYYLNKAMQIDKRYNNTHLYSRLNTLAWLYAKTGQYDSAFYYFHSAINVAKNSNRIEKEAHYLSELGNLFFDVNKIDSALYYINLSNVIANENNFLRLLSSNYHTLSEIAERKGDNTKSLEYFKKHVRLKDSVYNVEVFGDVNQFQRLYEVSKTNQQIEQLVIDKQIKERTIYYQKMIQQIIMVVLLLAIIVLVFIVYQNKKLKTAYKVLFNKNVEIIKIQEEPSAKNKKSANTFNSQDELTDKILTVMEDPANYCDATFTIDKLASLTQSNHTYVSTAIKNSFNQNFRLFLNSYRIREAQRMFMQPDAEKYTIEFVSEQVGFKSRTSFYEAFKEITGVSPKFYLKSMQQQDN